MPWIFILTTKSSLLYNYKHDFLPIIPETYAQEERQKIHVQDKSCMLFKNRTKKLFKYF